MSIAWEAFVNADDANEYAHVTYRNASHNAGNIIELDDEVVCIDVRTTKRSGKGADHVYRFFPNGVVDKGTPGPFVAADPSADPATQAPDDATRAVKAMLRDIAADMTGAYVHNVSHAFRLHDTPGGAGSEYAHRYLAEQGRRIAEVLRRTADTL